VLRLLRRHDQRYRLHLIGDDFDATASTASREYGERLAPELAELEADGAVRRTGRTDDVPAALSKIGVIVSSSVRESFHAGLVEGAASGAVPVVRNWPFFACVPSGARSLFPDDWVVADPEQAVVRILETTTNDETWRSVGHAASEHALASWDWDEVKGQYDELLRG
jgi:glycosyltransferase involved in cell wall biosynthesis